MRLCTDVQSTTPESPANVSLFRHCYLAPSAVFAGEGADLNADFLNFPHKNTDSSVTALSCTTILSPIHFWNPGSDMQQKVILEP